MQASMMVSDPRWVDHGPPNQSKEVEQLCVRTRQKRATEIPEVKPPHVDQVMWIRSGTF